MENCIDLYHVNTGSTHTHNNDNNNIFIYKPILIICHIFYYKSYNAKKWKQYG